MNFLSILSGLSQVHVGSNSDGRCSDTAVTKESDDCDPALTFALFDLEKSTCVSVQNLLKYVSHSAAFVNLINVFSFIVNLKE